MQIQRLRVILLALFLCMVLLPLQAELQQLQRPSGKIGSKTLVLVMRHGVGHGGHGGGHGGSGGSGGGGNGGNGKGTSVIPIHGGAATRKGHHHNGSATIKGSGIHQLVYISLIALLFCML